MKGLRLICVAVLLVVAACGPFGGAPDRGQGAGTGTARGPAPAPSAPPTGPAAVLVQLASASTYAVSLVFDDGRFTGPATARLRTVAPPLVGAAATVMPVFSTSDSRLYYLDGDTEVRFLERDGTQGSAVRVPGGARQQSGFAVSPDDRRIAVATVDYSSSPAATRLYVEDVAGGGNHVELPFPVAAAVWPIGWHDEELVVAVGSPPVQSVAGNPYGTFAGYQVIDANTGSRLATVACNPAGALTPAGTACLMGDTRLRVQDFAGRTRSLDGPPMAVVSAAEAPDGARVAFCCVGGELQLWDLGDGAVSGLVSVDRPDYGWIDPTHLLVSDGPALRPRVMDVTNGSSLWVAAGLGRVVARVPGRF